MNQGNLFSQTTVDNTLYYHFLKFKLLYFDLKLFATLGYINQMFKVVLKGSHEKRDFVTPIANP